MDGVGVLCAKAPKLLSCLLLCRLGYNTRSIMYLSMFARSRCVWLLGRTWAQLEVQLESTSLLTTCEGRPLGYERACGTPWGKLVPRQRLNVGSLAILRSAKWILFSRRVGSGGPIAMDDVCNDWCCIYCFGSTCPQTAAGELSLALVHLADGPPDDGGEARTRESSARSRALVQQKARPAPELPRLQSAWADLACCHLPVLNGVSGVFCFFGPS
jgi:hypothetical protein